jgi:hypothetical protein
VTRLARWLWRFAALGLASAGLAIGLGAEDAAAWFAASALAALLTAQLVTWLDRALDDYARIHGLDQYAPDHGAERAAARLADFELGLADPVHGAAWRSLASDRVDALEADARGYGLLPHEDAELDRLRALLAGAGERHAAHG